MLKYLNNQVEIACRYGLNPTELDIYNAVEIYCGKQPYNWKRNASQIQESLPYIGSNQTVNRALDKLIKVGAIKADGVMLTIQNGHKIVQNGQKDVQNGQNIVQNGQHINNNTNNNRERKEPDGGRSRAEIEKEDDFIVPLWSEVMDYARGRTNWRGSTQEMREEAADDYYAKMSECGWRVDGAPVVNWKPGVYRYFKQARKRYERESAARAATMFQAGYRPENRAYEHKVAMSERAAEEKKMEAAKAEAEAQSDEERQATFDTIERLQAHFAASENSKRVRQSGRTD